MYIIVFAGFLLFFLALNTIYKIADNNSNVSYKHSLRILDNIYLPGMFTSHWIMKLSFMNIRVSNNDWILFYNKTLMLKKYDQTSLNIQTITWQIILSPELLT